MVRQLAVPVVEARGPQVKPRALEEDQAMVQVVE